MNCPVDNELLQMTERSGVEVDYCPRCRGIWLDRGELDKILARADREFADDRRGFDDRRDSDDRRDFDDDDDDRSRYRERDEWIRTSDRPRKKRKNFLSEMFEFGED